MIKRKSKHEWQVTFPNTKLSSNQVKELQAWCVLKFGNCGTKRKYRWRYGWTHEDDVFYFRDQKDAAMFLLVWAV